MSINIKNGTLHKYLRVFIIAAFVLLVAVQAGKYFVLDELDFPIVSHATSQTLKPIYYRGEANPAEVGIYHPTLYINTLSLFIRVFGYSEVSIRFFGVICTLISAYLLIAILRQLAKKNEATETLLLGLFLLNPYTIANTTLPDIDSTVLPVLLLLFIHFALRLLLQRKDMSNRTMLILAVLFGLTLWSKLTTPLVIPFFLAGLATITTKDYKRSLLFTLKVTLIGAVGFVVTYFIYCKLLGLSTTYTYHFLVDSFTKGTSSQGPVTGALNNLKSLRQFIYWPTIPVTVLYGISFLGVVFDPGKDTVSRVKKLLVVTGLAVIFFYIALIAPFGGFFKYPFPAFGIAILTIIFFYDRYFRNTKLAWFYMAIAFLLGFGLEKIFWKDTMFLSGQPFRYLPLLLLLVVAAYILIRKYITNVTAALLLLFMLFAIGFQLSISRIQAIAPYPTKYEYGQMGLTEAVSYLKANTKPNEAIWSMKDVGYYVNNKYYESYAYYFDPALQSDLINMLKGSKVRYYVTTTGIGQDDIDYYANIKQILNTYAAKDKQFGNYIIYKSKE